MTVRLAIFDCDGTLVDGQHSICTAMIRTFEGANLTPPERHRILDVVGLSLVPAIARLLPEADAGLHIAMAERYKTAFHDLRAEGAVHEPLFDGIAALIARLDEKGWLLGIATGKSDRGLALVLGAHGLTHKFVTLQTADHHPSKPHPAMLVQAMADAGAGPQTTVMIGDTSFDMEMAVAAGAKPLGVGWGYHAPDILTAAGAISIAMDSNALYRHIAAHA